MPLLTGKSLTVVTRNLVALLVTASLVCACQAKPQIGRGEAFLGGDGLSTVAQVRESLEPAKAGLLAVLKILARGEMRERLVAVASCDLSDPVCRHSAPFSSAQRTDTRDLIIASVDEMIRILEGNLSPIQMVDETETIPSPSGPRDLPAWTLPTIGAAISLSVPQLTKVAPADLKGTVIAFIAHELLHQVTRLGDTVKFKSFVEAEGFRACASFAGELLRDLLEISTPTPATATSPDACLSSTTESKNVVFTNGTSQSSVARIPLSCANPVLIADTKITTLECSEKGGGGHCESDAASTQTPVHTRVDLEQTEIGISLGTADPVWVGASSPLFPVNYSLVCLPTQNFYSMCRRAATTEGTTVVGNTYVVFSNGTRVSSKATLPVPEGCVNPRVRVMSYTPTVECKVGAGAGACPSRPQRTSQAITARVTNDSVEIHAADPVWVGAISPRFSVSYEISCF